MKGLIVSITVLVFCISCGSGPLKHSSDGLGRSDPASLSKVVSDLMSVMEQLTDPETTTVQYTETDSVLGIQIYDSLRQREYAVQKVIEDQGANYLTFEEVTGTGSNGGRQYRYTIMIGEVAVERSYADKSGLGIYPTSPVIVRGSVEPVALDPDIFQLRDQDLGSLYYVEYRSVDELAGRVPKVTLITQQLIDEIASKPAQLPEEVGLNASRLETKNVFYTNESNFSEITRNYRMVRRDIIAFSNDSLRLGTDGKRKVRQIFRNFNQDTDVISLLGCSNGYTALDIGNQGLALGRAERVLQEFQSLGVSRTSLLDEGCWAPEAFDGRYPGRGVIVELKRRST